MKQHNWTILLLVLIIALAGCGGAPAAQPAPAQAAIEVSNLPVDLNAQTVDSLRSRDDVVVLDVREDYEYAEGHIPGAVLVPLGQIPNRLAEIPKDKTVLVVCRSGNRSNQATQFLRQQGFDNVHNMTGGMIDWAASGYQVEK